MSSVYILLSRTCFYSPDCCSDGVEGCAPAPGATANTRLATFRAMADTADFLRLHREMTAEFFSGNKMIVEATPGVPPFIATTRVPYFGSSLDVQPNAHGVGLPFGSGGR